MTSSMSKKLSSYESCPIIVIIGATGCGKTKLSLELAEYYKNVEIISADSMQIYKGLDIATNKATLNERKQVPHHLIDMIDPFQQFTVLDFQKLALKTIKEILSKNKIPIIVGGTNYYIESILWYTMIGNKTETTSNDEFKINENESLISDEQLITVNDLLKNEKLYYRNLRLISNEKLYQFLMEIDPESAKILHHNNRRKIIRCLQVYQQTGRKMSDILEEQRNSSDGGSRHGGPLRFENSIIFWVDCDKEILNKRLDERVDKMIEQGLLNELNEFHQNYNSKRFDNDVDNKKSSDYTEGIFQAIGLKEFHQYLLMNEEERNTYEGQLKLGHGILMLKQRTKTYVNKQMKWIRRRFLISKNIRNVPNVYCLDTTYLNDWNEKVLNHTIHILDLFLKAQSMTTLIEREKIFLQLNELAINRNIRNDDDDDESFISGQFYCDICHIKISGGESYQKHLKSKKHRYYLEQSKLKN